MLFRKGLLFLGFEAFLYSLDPTGRTEQHRFSGRVHPTSIELTHPLQLQLGGLGIGIGGYLHWIANS